jgi:hypothetical protein
MLGIKLPHQHIRQPYTAAICQGVRQLLAEHLLRNAAVAVAKEVVLILACGGTQGGSELGEHNGLELLSDFS